MKNTHRRLQVSVLALGVTAVVASCFSKETFVDSAPCRSAADCDDGNPCTADACLGGVCGHAGANAGQACAGDTMTCNGAGQCAACASDEECGEAAPCAMFSCIGHACHAAYFADGTMLPDTATRGDCKRPQCDAKGAVVEVADPTDVPAASGPCNQGTCNGEVAGQSHLAAGAPCATGVCDGQGACVECLSDASCSAGRPHCLTNKCVQCADDAQCTTGTTPSCDLSKHACVSCSDGAQNGDEKGVDCGGSHCLGCSGDPCTTPGQCHSQVCICGDTCATTICQ